MKFKVTGAQASLAVGAVQVAAALLPEVLTEMFDGQAEKVGPATSPGHGSGPTVTVKLQATELLLASIAV